VAILPRPQLRTELSLNGEFRRVRCTTPRLSGEAELWYSYCGEVSVVRRKSDWSDDSWFQQQPRGRLSGDEKASANGLPEFWWHQGRTFQCTFHSVPSRLSINPSDHVNSFRLSLFAYVVPCPLKAVPVIFRLRVCFQKDRHLAVETV
jgi:hypothetical protein